MDIAEIFTEIRKRTGVSQQEFAASLNVSIVNPEFEGNTMRTGAETVELYHGSKSGITGRIRPISRTLCDFGQGFYMGTERSQPLTLICNFKNARLYTVQTSLEGLHILDVKVGIDWALLIAFHRGKMEGVKGTPIYNKYAEMTNGCDLVIGYIANDRMFMVLDRFFSGEITDTALIQSLSTLKLGKQYVALTDKACAQIEITHEEVLCDEDRTLLRRQSEQLRTEGIEKADEICRKYRREGRFFDEIIIEDASRK